MSKQVESVFISYRRQTSKYQALLVYKALSTAKYDVFIDYQSIDSGKFASEILRQIAARSHFLVILSPGCLDRTTNPEDWLRKEIEYALDVRRNVVPLLFDHFSFERDQRYLTGKLSALKDYNGLPVPDGYFDEAMKKLRARFLKKPVEGDLRPAPKTDNLFVQKALQKANHAAEQETSLEVFQRYVEKPSKSGDNPSKPTRRRAIAREPLRRRVTVPVSRKPAAPAITKVPGADLLKGEVIELDEMLHVSSGEKYLVFPFLPGPQRLIITNQRIILRDLERSLFSFEISRKDLIFAKVTYEKIGFLRTRLTIHFQEDKKKYPILLNVLQESKVRRFISENASPLSRSNSQ